MRNSDFWDDFKQSYIKSMAKSIDDEIMKLGNDSNEYGFDQIIYFKDISDMESIISLMDQLEDLEDNPGQYLLN